MTELLRAFFRLTLLPPVRLFYRLKVLHADRMPKFGGVLLVSNHISYLDSFILYAACPRPVRFVIVSRYMGIKAISWFLNLFGAIAITPGKSRDAIRITADCLKAGDVVCIFPEGQLTRTGMLNELKKGFELIARKADCPVMPVWMQGLWGSVFSFERGQYFHKWPHQLPWPVTVAFGELEEPAKAKVAWARESLLRLSAEAFGAHPKLETSLSASVVRGLKRRPGTVCFSEHLKDGKPARRLKRHHVLSTALALAARWKHSLPEDEKAIGILLPPGTTPCLINLGLILADRVPVNLPFPDAATGVLDPDEVSALIGIAGVRTVITSRAFFSILGDVDWPNGDGENPGCFLDMAAELSGAGLLARFRERILAYLEPKWMAVRRLGLAQEPGKNPVWARVADGKLHQLDDRAVLAQALRLTTGNWIEARETLFTERALTPPDGALWSLWMPVLHGHAAAGRSWSARDDATLIESVCREENVRRLVISPETAESIAALDEPWHPETREALRSVLIPVSDNFLTGSSRRPDPVESITGASICPFWAPNEADSGILAISQPDPNPEGLKHIHQPQLGGRDGSPGRLLPGIAIEMANGDDDLKFGGPGLGDGVSWVDAGVKLKIDAESFLFPAGKSSA